ncbi:MAG: Crp/Fnr family transcriptional regulator [Anaerolineales bacterium]|jgi:CRP/FNR family transcriptional regulator
MILSIELLGQNAVFSHLQVADLKFLVRESISRNYKKGERIAHYGDIWPYIFLVGQGKVTAVKESAEGRILTIVTIATGEIFWGAAFFQKGLQNLAALIADEDCQIFLWSQERILPTLLENGRVSWELSGLMVNRMQRASDIVEELAFQPVAVRLASFLVDYFKDSESERVARDLTLDEMAARVGSTREVVSRILHRFANQGLIEITRTEFTFTDKDGLRQFAQIDGEL